MSYEHSLSRAHRQKRDITLVNIYTIQGTLVGPLCCKRQAQCSHQHRLKLWRQSARQIRNVIKGIEGVMSAINDSIGYYDQGVLGVWILS